MQKISTRGQIAMEYLFIVGFGFLLLIPVIILFYTQTGQLDTEITAAQAKKSIDEIVAAADLVYALGAPSKQTLKVKFPEHVTDVSFFNNSLVMTVDGPSGEYALVGVATVNLTGTIETYSGTHVLLIQALADEINITES